MRIALLTGELPALGHGGGVGTYTATLACALRAEGADVRIIVASDNGIIQVAEAAAIRSAGHWRGPVLARPLAAASGLEAEIDRFDPHIIEAPNWGGLGAALRLTGRPLVVRLSTPVLAIRPRDPLRRLAALIHHVWERRSVQRAALVIADSDAVAKLTRRCYDRNADVIIPHPLVASECAQPPEGRGMLVVGRLEHRKGTDLILAAWRSVRQALPDWTLHLVGADRSGFGARAMATYGSTNVIAHGFLDASALLRLAQACPMAVMPSRWESFGMAVLEAWDRGQAVIASDAGGLPEVVGPAGMIVPSNDPNALAAAMINMARDSELQKRLARAGRERLLARFAPATCAAATLEAYRVAIAKCGT